MKIIIMEYLRKDVKKDLLKLYTSNENWPKSEMFKLTIINETKFIRNNFIKEDFVQQTITIIMPANEFTCKYLNNIENYFVNC